MAEVTVPSAPPLATVPNVELMHTGQWPISTGIANFTTGDLASAVAALDCPAVRRPVLKLGHSEPDPDEHGMRWDGEPAVGYIANLAVVEAGQTLVGDYAGMPGWLAGEVLASAYPDRSIEGQYDFRCQIGHVHPFVITAVALLGVVPPGIGTLQSLQDVAALYGVTDTGPVESPADGIAAAAEPAAGTPFTITVHAAREDAVPNPRPAEVRAGVTTDDVRRAFYGSDYGRSWDIWICEMQLGPELQLIIIDDSTGSLSRVPVTVGEGDGEDAVEFAEPVKVVVRYEDATVAAAAPRAGARMVFASRQESRPATVRAATVSDTDWSTFTEADYDIDQWKTACLIDTGEGDETSKDRYKVPVREPDGTLNRHGCHAAAGGHGISAVEGISDEVKMAAAKALVKLYQDELEEDPPASLLELAGMDDDSADGDGEDEDADGTAAAKTAGARARRRATKNSPAAAGAPTQEGAGMDPAKLREALGLPSTASDDEVRTALAEQGVTPAAPADGGAENEGAPDGGSDAAGEGTAAGQDGASASATSLPPGTVVMDEAAVRELRAAAEDGRAARAQQRREERDLILSEAIKAGKFPPASRAHWEKYWEHDEAGARAAIADLAPGLVPVTDNGVPGSESDAAAAEGEFDSLFTRPIPAISKGA